LAQNFTHTDKQADVRSTSQALREQQTHLVNIIGTSTSSAQEQQRNLVNSTSMSAQV
jgi:hypothetical protein